MRIGNGSDPHFPANTDARYRLGRCDSTHVGTYHCGDTLLHTDASYHLGRCDSTNVGIYR